MEYPEEFKKKVEAELPEDKGLHEALEEGRDSVGDYLDCSRFEMGPHAILLAFKKNQQHKSKKRRKNQFVAGCCTKNGKKFGANETNDLKQV